MSHGKPLISFKMINFWFVFIFCVEIGSEFPPIQSLLERAASLDLDPFDSEFAAKLDAEDELSSFRNEFHIPR
jgi:hypothetical protein